MERIRIPNEATYAPVSLMDVALLAPIVSRVLFRRTLPGRLVRTAAVGMYVASAARDWAGRRAVRRIDFLEEFGADGRHLVEMPEAERRAEVEALVGAANEAFSPRRIPREDLAIEVDRHLTDFIATITGQRIETSTEVRGFGVAQLIFPFALGACDFLSGDIAIFHDTGVLEPHVIAHEFVHRKGYWKELEAQVLAYFALAGSSDPILMQSARCERLHRHLRVLAGDEPDDYERVVRAVGLRSELESQLLCLRPRPGPIGEKVEAAMKVIYEERMRLTGQNGLEDYDRGFTNFLYTIERDEATGAHPGG